MVTWMLFAHGWIRWIVLASALASVALALRGWLGARPWLPAQKGLAIALIASLDLQILLGMLLYMESSWPGMLADSFGAVMKNPAHRFWAVEHVTAMVAGAALIHVGYAKAKRAEADADKHRAIATWVGGGLLIVLAGIPWPFKAGSAGRPWLPAVPA